MIVCQFNLSFHRFNPRARAGRDTPHLRHAGHAVVSIHAPARGATSGSGPSGCKRPFQSTRPRGARQPQGPPPTPEMPFQSTRPRGARRSATSSPATRSRFNPRARAGRDIIIILKKMRKKCFNPRARAGRDNPDFSKYRPICVSIHAPARGATRIVRLLIQLHRSFNPRARAGRDIKIFR